VSEAGGKLLNYPEADSSEPYNIEGLGVIAGSETCADTIFSLLKGP
jgi:hypothetical protein